MNYYNPNFYQNYPYVNQQMAPQYQTQQLMPSQMQQTLNGKIVDSEEVVKATEVPIGGYGVFPKADFSKVYLKTWNSNGTTSIITFQPAETDAKESEDLDLKSVASRVAALEEKIKLLSTPKKEGIEY